jgi:hypothetical protein
MKLSELNLSLTNKWHQCQTNMSLYDEKTNLSLTMETSIKEKPDKDGLYLIYMWDFRVQPHFHYEIVTYETKITFTPNYFLRIDHSNDQYNYGQIRFETVIKWMYYEDFLNLIEGKINYD